MSTATSRRTRPAAADPQENEFRRANSRARRGTTIPPLHNGDRLSQAEFHRRYLAYPENVKFELIDGVVYMASPMRLPHVTQDRELTTILNLYRAATPGVESAPNASVILGDKQEPQPDHLLRILPEYGGNSGTTPEKYIAGAPEWIAEVAHSTAAIDLHRKKEDYRRSGVREYVVVCLEEEEVRWFDLERDSQIPIAADGVLRSFLFPGLWIDTAALLQLETNRLIAVLQQGLATAEHQEFVDRLAARHGEPEPARETPKSHRGASKKRSPRKRRRST